MLPLRVETHPYSAPANPGMNVSNRLKREMEEKITRYPLPHLTAEAAAAATCMTTIWILRADCQIISHMAPLFLSSILCWISSYSSSLLVLLQPATTTNSRLAQIMPDLITRGWFFFKQAK
jgi:hypothetical protein